MIRKINLYKQGNLKLIALTAKSFVNKKYKNQIINQLKLWGMW